jgi:hypothetical protein
MYVGTPTCRQKPQGYGGQAAGMQVAPKNSFGAKNKDSNTIFET